MPIDKVEVLELLKLFVAELVDAYKTDGKVTLAEWLAIAEKVGKQAFGDFQD